ncbi:MAG TPA: RsmD family RNA methyltransferase, partial [Actinomycetota bacterium]|nr:RsmD family RNA methyltransferase [Actinomycetota bacterium]
MRIVAGSAKGVRLAPVPPGVRPVSDVAREGLFSSLGDRVAGARVLDLYAGTGALGIEALSRGAASAVFVERARRAVRTIRDNLERTRLASRAVVRAGDVVRFVMSDDKSIGPFDLCLLDPPYETGADELGRVLSALASGWLAPGGWRVALTRGSRSSTPVIPVDWRVTR